MECGIQTDPICDNTYLKNGIFDTLYENFIQYKKYVNDMINALIPYRHILNKTEKRYLKAFIKNQSFTAEIENSKPASQSISYMS